MRVRPERLNTTIAWLFIVGSACFVVGSIPAYVHAAGGWVDSVTYFVGSIFFTSASLAQLVQTQSPGMTGVDAEGQRRRADLTWWRWLPHDLDWCAAVTQLPGTVFFNISTFAALAHNATVAATDRHVWRPDAYGSTLFLVASCFGILAARDSRSAPWRISWVNMVGSVLFMLSAIGSYVLPSGNVVSTRATVAGTLLGAVCFLVGAAWMFPAWRSAVAARQ